MQRKLLSYETRDGRSPFEDWLKELRDNVIRGRAVARLNRVLAGNFGDHRWIGGGLLELRLDFGPGYRMYAGIWGEELIILLCGGEKKTQGQDIELARKYWADWRSGR